MLDAPRELHPKSDSSIERILFQYVQPEVPWYLRMFGRKYMPGWEIHIGVIGNGPIFKTAFMSSGQRDFMPHPDAVAEAAIEAFDACQHARFYGTET